MTRFHRSCRRGVLGFHHQLAALVRKEPPVLHFAEELYIVQASCALLIQVSNRCGLAALERDAYVVVTCKIT